MTNIEKPLYIFDVDGTLTDPSHRLHYISSTPKDWDSFLDEARNDPPHMYVLEIMRGLIENDNATVIIVTARKEKNREMTIEWLQRNRVNTENLPIYMRETKDRRHDYIVKEEILDNEIIPKYGKPSVVFEDRNRVIDMWRSRGIHVFDCNLLGDF